MRTTVDIPDGTYRRLKSWAAREGTSTRALVLRGVKEVLKTERRKAGVPVSLPIVRSKRPGTVALSNAAVYDVAFPEINVWVALTYDRVARIYNSLSDALARRSPRRRPLYVSHIAPRPPVCVSGPDSPSDSASGSTPRSSASSMRCCVGRCSRGRHDLEPMSRAS